MVLCRYVEHDTLIWEYLNSSIHLVADDIKHMVVLMMIIGVCLSVIETTKPYDLEGLGEFQESSWWPIALQCAPKLTHF